MVLLLAGVLVIPRILAEFGGNSMEPNAAGGGQPPLNVRIHTAAIASLDEIVRATGTLLAEEEVALSAETAGRITGIYFQEGAFVEEGSLLVKINDAALQAEREQLINQRALAEFRENRLRELLSENATSQDTYEIAATEVKVLTARIMQLDAQIEKTEIRAPFDGVMGLRQISTGAFLSLNSDIAVIRRLDPIRLEFSIPERYANYLSSSPLVRFQPAGSDEMMEAELYAFEPSVERATRSIRVRARFPNPEYRFIPGSFARIEWTTNRNEEALMVPAMAVVTGSAESSLYIYAEGQARRRTVQTGIRTAEMVQILEGISEGDPIITTGIQQLRDGLRVQIRN